MEGKTYKTDYNNNNNCSMALYLRQPEGVAPEFSATLTQHTALIVLKFLTNTPNFPSQSTSRV